MLFNEELRLGRTLSAIKDLADEIIVVDSFSSDKTVEIAKSFGAKVYQIPWPGYGEQKNNVIERYTTEGATVALGKNKSAGFFNIVINPIFKFLRMYIFRLGFLDGVEGLALSIFSSLYTSVKYLKLREMKKQK